MAGAQGVFEGTLDSIVGGRNLLRSWLYLGGAIVVGGGVYGAVLGMWSGGRLVVYDMVKLPLVLILTSGFTVLLSWLAATALGVRVRFLQVAGLTFLALAVASVLLASLAPVVWLFTVSAPAHTPDARTAHNLLYLMHVIFVGGAGLVGTRVLWVAMSRFNAPRRALCASYVLWLASYAFVGSEVAWAMRPFVGSVYLPVAFLRTDALDGNVFEFIFTDIAPHLMRELD